MCVLAIIRTSAFSTAPSILERSTLNTRAWYHVGGSRVSLFPSNRCLCSHAWVSAVRRSFCGGQERKSGSKSCKYCRRKSNSDWSTSYPDMILCHSGHSIPRAVCVSNVWCVDSAAPKSIPKIPKMMYLRVYGKVGRRIRIS